MWVVLYDEFFPNFRRATKIDEAFTPKQTPFHHEKDQGDSQDQLKGLLMSFLVRSDPKLQLVLAFADAFAQFDPVQQNLETNSKDITSFFGMSYLDQGRLVPAA